MTKGVALGNGTRMAAALVLFVLFAIVSPIEPSFAQSLSDPLEDFNAATNPADISIPGANGELPSAPFTEDAGVADAHAKTLKMGRFQSEFGDNTPSPPPEPPGWLMAILEFIGSIFEALAPLFTFLLWGGAGLIVLAIIAVILREAIGMELPFRKKAKSEDVEIGYRPSEDTARTLLEDADRLAAAGRFEEAARLLLSRSIQDIETERAVSIPLSLTSREIARIDAIPGNARPAFSEIALIVEDAVFAGHGLDKSGYDTARKAYEAFALPEVWQ